LAAASARVSISVLFAAGFSTSGGFFSLGSAACSPPGASAVSFFAGASAASGSFSGAFSASAAAGAFSSFSGASGLAAVAAFFPAVFFVAAFLAAGFFSLAFFSAAFSAAFLRRDFFFPGFIGRLTMSLARMRTSSSSMVDIWEAASIPISWHRSTRSALFMPHFFDIS